jgi:hypothetical protein
MILAVNERDGWPHEVSLTSALCAVDRTLLAGSPAGHATDFDRRR